MNDRITHVQHLVSMAPEDLIGFMEKVIRDLAGTVNSDIFSRKHHPSYGVTVRQVHKSYDRMEGAIGLFMAVTAQANHGGSPNMAKFSEQDTTDVVREARAAVRSMNERKP